MLDFFNIPEPRKANKQIFYANDPTGGTNWIAWQKPRGVSFAHILALGGGGGGGSGCVGAASTAATAAFFLRRASPQSLRDRLLCHVATWGIPRLAGARGNSPTRSRRNIQCS